MRNSGICCNCGAEIRRNSPGGDWYHTRTASTACWPGRSGAKHASPVEVSA